MTSKRQDIFRTISFRVGTTNTKQVTLNIHMDCNHQYSYHNIEKDTSSAFLTDGLETKLWKLSSGSVGSPFYWTPGMQKEDAWLLVESMEKYVGSGELL